MMEHPLGSASASSDDRFSLSFERSLPYAQAAVWTAVSTAAGIANWLALAEIDLRPHGRFRLSGKCNVEGEVLEVSAPRLLRWTWPHADHPWSEVNITVQPIGADASHLTLVQTGLLNRNLADVAAGWHTHLDALPAAVLGKHTAFDAAREAVHYRRYAEAFGL
jgi:uncharacterized protein YndB with AHSA1/START domain